MAGYLYRTAVAREDEYEVGAEAPGCAAPQSGLDLVAHGEGPDH
jgi:hypothetical protein